MSATLITTVYDWLKELKILISKAYIGNQLNFHLGHSYVLSLTGTLDEFCLNSVKLRIAKSRYKIPPKFLKYLRNKDSEFIDSNNII